MNKEQINMAIAESLGWKFNQQHPWVTEECLNTVLSPSGDWYSFSPEYCDSLDACAEFEATLTDDCNLNSGRVRYNNILMSICGSHAKCVSAKSSQRSEALLRLKGKWVES